jgi:carbamoylphosphate synthase large subunit
VAAKLAVGYTLDELDNDITDSVVPFQNIDIRNSIPSGDPR